MESLLSIRNLKKSFVLESSFFKTVFLKKKQQDQADSTRILHAVNDISFEILKGEMLALVGESGSGKSTIAQMIMRLLDLSSGSILYRDKAIERLSRKQLFSYRKKMQMIFQNPFASLSPRMRVQEIMHEPLSIHYPKMNFTERQNKTKEMLNICAMGEDSLSRFPHELSGGQQQRIAIARALISNCEFLVADEPVSALDVSVQAQILNILSELKKNKGLTCLFITHDLSITKHMADRIAVIYLGSLCEIGKTSDVFRKPLHPYTKALLSAVPEFGKPLAQRIELKGDIPTPVGLDLNSCSFASRCPYVKDRCYAEKPKLQSYGKNVLAACHGLEEKRL